MPSHIHSLGGSHTNIYLHEKKKKTSPNIHTILFNYKGARGQGRFILRRMWGKGCTPSVTTETGPSIIRFTGS